MLATHRKTFFHFLVGGISLVSCKSNEAKISASGLFAVGSEAEIVDGNYTIKGVESGKCIDVPRSTTTDNIILWQYTCNGTGAQLWKIKRIEGGFVTITNVGNGKALSIFSNSMADGGRLVQLPLGINRPNQQWSIIGDGGKLGIRSRASSKVVDVVDHGLQDMVQIQQWADVGEPHQRWVFTRVGDAGAPVPQPAPTPVPKPENPAPGTNPVPQTPAPMPVPAPVPVPAPAPAPAGQTGAVTVSGRQLLVGGQPYNIKGVCYNPVRKGQSHPGGILFLNPSAADLAVIEKDFTMMRAAGINTLRTYEPIMNDTVLALLNKYQLKVIVPVLNYYQATTARAGEIVNKLKGHPSTLMWEMGNEWNYNHLYGVDAGFSYDAAKRLLLNTSNFVKTLDKTHPTSTAYGELPPQALVNEFVNIDVWAINIYAGLGFGDRFGRWKGLSGKPMYVGEFGADAVNVNRLDVNSQATATGALINEIAQNLSSKNPGNAALGGSIFEWSDEWWKDGKGSPAAQDIGGIAPGSGPYPDNVFNEEYWGIVDIDRNPRPAYQKLKEGYGKF